MKSLIVVLAVLIGCVPPKAEETDALATVCKSVPDYWVESPGHRPRHVIEECRLTKYWAVVDGKWVAR